MDFPLKIAYLFILLTMCVSNSLSFAAIAFTNGEWRTTFNCDESTQYNGNLCDGLEWAGNWFFEDYRFK